MIAVDKLAEQLAEELAHAKGQEVENAVEHGQGHDMAHKEGAEGGKGVEEQGKAHLGDEPLEQRPQHQGARHRLHRQGEQEHNPQGQHQEAEAGQVIGQVKPLPPDGQGVVELDAAAVIEVGEHGHGADNGPHRRQNQAHGADKAQQVHGHNVDVQSVVPVQPGQQEGEGNQEQNHPVGRPDGPEALEVLAVQGGIPPGIGPLRAQCRGRHSPHLPVHK